MALIGIIFGAFLCLYLVHYVKRYFWDYRDMKGPSVFLSVPIIGHAWALSPNPHKTLEDLKTTYGNLFRFDIGPYPSLVVAGLEEFQEMCRMDVFNGRFFGILPAVQTVFGTDSRGEVFGVSASNGQTWAEQRKFMHQNLNVAGMGKKSTLENIINQEAEIAAERMASGAKNGPVCIKKFFPVAINNIVWRMITGNTSSQDDPLMLYLTDRMNRHFESLSPSNITAILQQYFHRFTNILDKLNMPTCFKDLYIIREFLDNEFKKIDPDPNGLYVAKFKAEIQAAASNPQSSFHETDGEFHLSGHAVDLFVAAPPQTRRD
uniref:Cytochrome P450 CYP3028B1 n=1 Tax=Tigriopus japonicus TaxID=158387 RepID=A0A088DKQ9_TIGJA|nr:cytochrome P450 CYP3028B1 [Tigriopus japonicus]